MKLGTVLSKANNIVRYLQTRGKRRLYKQWVERGDLAPEAIPPEEAAKDIILIPKIDKKQLRLNILYMLLGASLLILCVGLILLIMQSC